MSPQAPTAPSPAGDVRASQSLQQPGGPQATTFARPVAVADGNSVPEQPLLHTANDNIMPPPQKRARLDGNTSSCGASLLSQAACSITCNNRLGLANHPDRMLHVLSRGMPPINWADMLCSRPVNDHFRFAAELTTLLSHSPIKAALSILCCRSGRRGLRAGCRRSSAVVLCSAAAARPRSCR